MSLSTPAGQSHHSVGMPPIIRAILFQTGPYKDGKALPTKGAALIAAIKAHHYAANPASRTINQDTVRALYTYLGLRFPPEDEAHISEMGAAIKGVRILCPFRITLVTSRYSTVVCVSGPLEDLGPFSGPQELELPPGRDPQPCRGYQGPFLQRFSVHKAFRLGR
jgi:hypothetical protein